MILPQKFPYFFNQRFLSASPVPNEPGKEFYARPDVEFFIAGALLDGWLQNPTFLGEDDGRKQD